MSSEPLTLINNKKNIIKIHSLPIQIKAVKIMFSHKLGSLFYKSRTPLEVTGQIRVIFAAFIPPGEIKNELKKFEERF